VMEFGVQVYDANEIAYNSVGPNSNSLASWLVQPGNLRQYLTALPPAVGWNTPVYQSAPFSQ
jgi:hypothetical protein